MITTIIRIIITADQMKPGIVHDDDGLQNKISTGG